MAIVGQLIKAAVNVAGNFAADPIDPAEKQKKQLRALLDQAKNTAFGKYYGFTDLLSYSDDICEEFRERVPVFEYDMLNAQWWEKQQQYPDITWPGKPRYFALTSGTTGSASKRIPVTDDIISAVKGVGQSLIARLPNYGLPANFFEGEILMLSSSADLQENPKGFKEGEISGINVSNFPEWYDTFYRPGKKIAAIGDWDARLAAIVKEAPNWNITAMCGIPSWLQLMMKAIIKHYRLDTIHDMWPNLRIFCSGGVAYDPYKESFDKICKYELTIIDTYLASEGFFAYSSRPNSLAMTLAIEHGYYFEFIPFDEDGFDDTGQLLENPQVLTIDEVEENKDYALLVSTCAGAWRYMIGDTVKFTNWQAAEIEITGRTKFFLNVVGSQLSEEKINEGIKHVCSELNILIDEFTVSALQDQIDGHYYHQWIVGCDEEFDEKRAVELLDRKLKSINKNYKVARKKALEEVRMLRVNKEKFFSLFESQGKMGGQTKTPKVVKPDKMKTYMAFFEKA